MWKRCFYLQQRQTFFCPLNFHLFSLPFFFPNSVTDLWLFCCNISLNQHTGLILTFSSSSNPVNMFDNHTYIHTHTHPMIFIWKKNCMIKFSSHILWSNNSSSLQKRYNVGKSFSFWIVVTVVIIIVIIIKHPFLNTFLLL